MKKGVLIISVLIIVMTTFVFGQNTQYVVDETLRTVSCEATSGWTTDIVFKDANNIDISHCVRKETYSADLQFVASSYLNVQTSGENSCIGGYADHGSFKDDKGNAVVLCVERKTLNLSNSLLNIAMTNIAMRQESQCPYTVTTLEKITLNGANYTHCVQSAQVVRPPADCNSYTGAFPQADSSCQYRIDLGSAETIVLEGSNFVAPLFSGDDDVCPFSLDCTCIDGNQNTKGWQCAEVIEDDCIVTNLQWLDVYGNVITQAYGSRRPEDHAADSVKLSADFNQGCEGKTIVYELFEDDSYEDDVVGGIVASAGRTDVTTVLSLEGFLGNELFEAGVAEYYFRVEVDGITQSDSSGFLRSPTLTLFVPRCEDGILKACEREGECLDVGGVAWQNNECLNADQVQCDSDALEYCTTENTCEFDGGGDWTDGLCISKDRCKEDNLDKCDEDNCEGFGGRWTGEECVEREECAITSAHWEDEDGALIETPVDVTTEVDLVAAINEECFGESIDLIVELRRRGQIIATLDGIINDELEEVRAIWEAEYPDEEGYEEEERASYYFIGMTSNGDITSSQSDILVVVNPDIVVTDDGGESGSDQGLGGLLGDLLGNILPLLVFGIGLLFGLPPPIVAALAAAASIFTGGGGAGGFLGNLLPF